MTEEQIKQDLIQIRLYKRDIASLTREKESIEYLPAKTKDRIESKIKALSVIYEKYIDAIMRLEPIDRIIVLDGIINKTKTYSEIAEECGYSTVGIQRRSQKVFGKIKDKIEVKEWWAK